MDITIDVNNSIPLWGIFCAALAAAFYIIKMDFRIDKRITIMENDMKAKSEALSKEIIDQGKTLDQIKELVYEFLTPKK